MTAVAAARALAHIEKSFTDAGLSPESTAQRLRISSRYLQRLLETSGISFTARVNELRLQKAKAAGLENDPDVRRRYEALLAGRVDDLELKPQLEQLTVSPEEISAAYQKELVR